MMVVSENKEAVLDSLQSGSIDYGALSDPNLIDKILQHMKEMGLLDELEDIFPDRRAKNQSIPLSLLLALAIAAKMKRKLSMTDIPYAITDADVLASFGWNLLQHERPIEDGLMSEGSLRNFVNKYESEEIVQFYNEYVQEHVLPHLNVSPSIHILDCTFITVPLENDNYEESGVVKRDGEVYRGYKLASIRGIVEDTGILEEIKLGPIQMNDLELSRELVMNFSIFSPGDILINDRGFISRELLNFLKSVRGVDTYMPLKSNMDAYTMAVSVAEEEDNWIKHPNKDREGQKIAFVENLGPYWRSDDPDNDVDFNACVVYDCEEDEYYVFITTDLEQGAKAIVSTYELRPEIEEDYRQVKDFWEIENFKSTKYHIITFHIVMLLFGYLFFQIYTTTEEGNDLTGKTLPVVVKNYISHEPKRIILYAGDHFGLFSLVELMEIIKDCSDEVFNKMRPVFASV